MLSPVCQAHQIRPPGVMAMVGSPCHILSSSAYVSSEPSETGRSVTPGSVDQKPTTGGSSSAALAGRTDAADATGAHSDAAMTAANKIQLFFISSSVSR